MRREKSPYVADHQDPDSEVSEQCSGTDGKITHGDCYEQNTASGEQPVVVERLPNRIPTTFVVSVQRHLSGLLALKNRGCIVTPTSVSNQNLCGNCRNIFVYVPYLRCSMTSLQLQVLQEGDAPSPYYEWPPASIPAKEVRTPRHRVATPPG